MSSRYLENVRMGLLTKAKNCVDFFQNEAEQASELNDNAALDRALRQQTKFIEIVLRLNC